MTTSPDSAGSVNGTDTANTLERGLQLTGTLAEAPDVAINPPLNLNDPADESPEIDHELAEAAADFAEMDSRQHLDLSRCLTLDELIERQIEFYESWQNEAGKMFALHMTELLIKYHGAGSAATPAEAMARIEVLEQDVRQDWEARGYDAGFEAGCRQAMPYNGPLD
jgi:hypothetical protein